MMEASGGLEVRLRKRLGDFTLEVDFSTSAGVLGLLGASGCGKSMTLKCIAGVEKPDEGCIVLNGRTLFDNAGRVNLPPQKRRVGYLFQDYALFPDMTVCQNVLCGARTAARAEEYLRRYALETVRDRYPVQLSGGEKQRTALARMLAAEPEAILLDEPFTALDQYLKARMERQVMSMLEGFDGPVVFVSHDRNEVYRLTDTIAVLEQGRIVDISEKHALFRAPKTLASTLLTGCKNVTRLRRLADGRYRALDWGIVLRGPKASDAEYRYAAFRAHDAVPAEGPSAANTLECDILREIEDAFSIVVQFYEKNSPDRTENALLTYETDKAAWRQLRERGDGLFLRIPEDTVIWLER